MAEVKLIDGNKAEAVLRNIADHLKEAGKTDLWPATYAAADVIKQQPTIDPESLRPTGRWEDMYGGQFDNPLIVCPVCKEPALEKSAKDLLGNWWARQEQSNYCPNCGAKMNTTE